MKTYFNRINAGVKICYDVAQSVKELGMDPDMTCIPLAKNMAERVEGIISVVIPQIKGSGVAERIGELEKEYGVQDWRVAMKVALEVAQEKFCKFKDKREAMETGMRVGLAYVTNGVVSSPLEGFVKLEIRKRKDNKEYFALFFSGPIRSAGTTATCVFAGICDYIRVNMGYEPYDPTENEVKRMVTELYDFHERVTNLQYLPSEQEISFMVSHLPLQIDGDPSEKFEVSNYKDIPRIETNRLRNGVCLVIGEGLTQKGKKFWTRFSKWYKEFGMDHWLFMDDFVKLQSEIKAKIAKSKVTSDAKISPDGSYLKDLVGGRPIFSYPLSNGGFRLRYGRCRTSGFSSDAIHPATMAVLDEFLAIGSQLRTERPGKSTTLSACDYMEGPIVKLNDGSVLYLETAEQAKNVVKNIKEIIYLGDILINYGDFLNRGHTLIPAGFCEEWWIHYLKKYLKESNYKVNDELIKNPIKYQIPIEEAIKISLDTKIPFHPRYTYHWKNIRFEPFKEFIDWVLKATVNHEMGKIVKIIFSFKEEPKRTMELLGIPHKTVGKEYVVLEKNEAMALSFQLGFSENMVNYAKLREITEGDPLEIINKLCPVTVKDKSGYFIGARMGRPEKAKMRKMTGNPHGLFSIGKEGGRLRSIQSALEAGKVKADFPIYFCEKCKTETIYPVCDNCNSKAKKKYYCITCSKTIDEEKCGDHKVASFNKREIDISRYFKSAMKLSNLSNAPKLIKGVRGSSNKDATPEHLLKMILRAKNNIFVNKEGTTRYDMSEMTITHFKPKEIGTSIEKLKEIGYEKDIYGKELFDTEQILELKCQDVILPGIEDGTDEPASKVFFKIASFIDDLLVNLYKKEPFYNLKNEYDIVGHLGIALSPHTSAGIVVRIIGFSKTQGFLAHPLLHSIMRRDCDGDEAGVMLLMDALLNFSRQFLPNRRGVTQDAPLVLTSNLTPSEVDDMVFDMDVAWEYPLEFYQAAEQFKKPYEIKIERYGDNLNQPKQYEGLGFTHHTTDINEGVRVSAYKTIPSMGEKVAKQMALAEKIRAVDESDVARLLIERHFLRDIKGCLRKYSQQQLRCVSCNEILRRVPLAGKCPKCNGKIIFTIPEGSVIKYLDYSLQLAKNYKLSPYLNQTLNMLKDRIDSVFGIDPEKQICLGNWCKKT